MPRAPSASSSLLERRASRRASTPRTAREQERLRELYRRAPARSRSFPTPKARAQRLPIDVASARHRHARRSRPARARRLPARGARAVHRLDVLLPRLGAAREVSRRSSSTRATARRRASSSTTRRSCSTRSSTSGCSQASGVYGFWPANADGDDIVVSPTRRARSERAALPHAAPAGDRRPTSSTSIARSPTTSRRSTAACPTTRRLRRDGRHRRRRLVAERSRPRTTTTTRSWSRRWPTGWPRRSPSAARARPGATGATAQSEALGKRRADRREVPRHPPGLRLPGLPRPHREDAALRAARGGGDRHQSHRELRDAAGGVGERPLLRPPEARYFALGKISRDQVEAYAGARASRSARPSGCCPRTSPTTRIDPGSWLHAALSAAETWRRRPPCLISSRRRPIEPRSAFSSAASPAKGRSGQEPPSLEARRRPLGGRGAFPLAGDDASYLVGEDGDDVHHAWRWSA